MESEVPAIIYTLLPLIVVAAIWSAVWKGLALWHSARRAALGWFIVFLFVNTLGILEIIYLFWVAKLKPDGLFKKQS